MEYISTNRKAAPAGFEVAITNGLAPDHGLYMPRFIPEIPDLISRSGEVDQQAMAYQMMYPFVKGVIGKEALQNIVDETFNFDIPLVQLDDQIWSLELFHGPTLAFKDVGARFLARCLNHLLPPDEKLTILVATSGDTGSAVARGFAGLDQIEVVLLYPSGKVSRIQEQQLTTAGENVTALQIMGDFDDCQRLVKQAFRDEQLRRQRPMTSANSINIARWLPQSVYYAVGVAQLPSHENKTVISVPSGNYGNLTAGILAQRTGLPVDHFIAASNINNTVPEYLKTGQYRPRPSQETLSNAMDVGDPSNFARLLHLAGNEYKAVTKILSGFYYSDEETLRAIAEVHETLDYTLDPHGAIGYLGLKNFLDRKSGGWQGIFLETAHPAKFHESVSRAIHKKVEMPDRLARCLSLPPQSVKMPPDYQKFRSYLLEQSPG